MAETPVVKSGTGPDGRRHVTAHLPSQPNIYGVGHSEAEAIADLAGALAFGEKYFASGPTETGAFRALTKWVQKPAQRNRGWCIHLESPLGVS